MSELWDRHGALFIAIGVNLALIGVMMLVKEPPHSRSQADVIEATVLVQVEMPQKPQVADPTQEVLKKQEKEMLAKAEKQAVPASSQTSSASDPAIDGKPMEIHVGPQAPMISAESIAQNHVPSQPAPGSYLDELLHPPQNPNDPHKTDPDVMVYEIAKEHGDAAIIPLIQGMTAWHNGERRIDEALQKVPKTSPLYEKLVKVRGYMDEATARAGKADPTDRAEAMEKGWQKAGGGGNAKPYLSLEEVQGNGYGAGTGKRYSPGNDPWRKQKILLFLEKGSLECLPHYRDGKEMSDQMEKLLAILKKENDVDINDEWLSNATMTLPDGMHADWKNVQVDKWNGTSIIQSFEGTRIEHSFAMHIENELQHPTHDLVIVIDGHYLTGSPLYRDIVGYEALKFIPYFRKSGIRLFYVNYNNMENFPPAFKEAIRAAGGGFYGLRDFLAMVQGAQESRVLAQ